LAGFAEILFRTRAQLKKCSAFDDRLSNCRLRFKRHELRDRKARSQLAQGNELFELSYDFVASPTQFAHQGQTYSASTFVSWDEISPPFLR